MEAALWTTALLGSVAWLGGMLALAWRRLGPRRPFAADARGGDLVLLAFSLQVGAWFLFAAARAAVGPDAAALDTALGTQTALLVAIGAGFVIGAKLEGVALPFGLGGGGLKRRLGVVSLLYLLGLPAVLLLHEAVGQLLLEDPDARQDSALLLVAEGRPLARLALVLSLCTVTPLFEELVFRAGLQDGLFVLLRGRVEERARGPVAIGLATVAFTVLHPPFTWVPILVLGGVLGTLWHRTRCLWVPFCFHAVHNLVTVGWHLLFAPAPP